MKLFFNRLKYAYNVVKAREFIISSSGAVAGNSHLEYTALIRELKSSGINDETVKFFLEKYEQRRLEEYKIEQQKEMSENYFKMIMIIFISLFGLILSSYLIVNYRSDPTILTFSTATITFIIGYALG